MSHLAAAAAAALGLTAAAAALGLAAAFFFCGGPFLPFLPPGRIYYFLFTWKS